MSEAMIIAHRGESYDAPENTLAAINLAWERGAEAVECDIHLSKDNKVMVIHDDNTLRTTGVDKPVTDLTRNELQQLDAGKWKDKQWTNVKIPTLAEVLDTIPKNRKLLIEVKCNAKIITCLKNVLDDFRHKKEQIILMDFNYDTVAAMKRVFPNYKIFWLSTMIHHKYFSIRPEVLIRKILYAGLSGLNILAQKRIDKSFVNRVHNAGLKLFIWTVDDPSKVKRYIELGVDAIATNRARWIKDSLHI